MQHFALIAAERVSEFEVLDYSWADQKDVPSGTAHGLAKNLGDVGKTLVVRDPSTIHGPIEGRGAEINGVRVHSLRLSGLYAELWSRFWYGG
jgi:4-hydroxy-tetrahydrodipicolinate reductase